jgi:hypothetical protein
LSYDEERYANDPVFRSKVKAAKSAWAKANRPKINARRQHRRATDPKVAQAPRRSWLRCKYGITLEAYEAMVERQNGLCALCKRRPIEGLCVDHCHDANMLRLLLCHKCNHGLGNFDDNPSVMRAAADYVEIWRIIHASKGPTAKRVPMRISKSKKRKGAACLPTPSRP